SSRNARGATWRPARPTPTLNTYESWVRQPEMKSQVRPCIRPT
ncbi:uncharacterized protein METZ01_LOCUS362713, partial [marine metagenome]